jgi:IS30 family transposase
MGERKRKRKYKQLSSEERDLLSVMLAGGAKVREIARKLDRDPSSISREARRNSSEVHGKYLGSRAQGRAEQRRRVASRRARIRDLKVRKYVEKYLAKQWSPEQIAGRAKLKRIGKVSYETIYRYIYDHGDPKHRKELIACLRRAHRLRKPRRAGRHDRRGKIPNRTPLTERPAEAATRRRKGHWEGDTMVSRQSKAALKVMVDRKTRLTRIKRVPRRTKEFVTAATVAILMDYPLCQRRTLTLDNGLEYAGHEDITNQTEVQCFFTRPYTSWEKPVVENTNGLIREYFPKRTDFKKVTDEEVQFVEDRLNDRPRKCLGFKTPNEAFHPSVALRG